MQPLDDFLLRDFPKNAAATNEIRLWGKFWPFSFNYFACRQFFFIFKMSVGFLFFYFQSFVAAHRRFMNFLSLSGSNLYRWFHFHFFRLKIIQGFFSSARTHWSALRANYVVSIVNYRINLLHLAVLNSFPQFVFIKIFLLFLVLLRWKKRIPHKCTLAAIFRMIIFLLFISF